MTGTERFLVDTNIIIYFLSGVKISIKWINNNSNSLFLSVISKIEVLSYPYSPKEERVVLKFLDQFTLLNINDQVVKETIAIRRKFKRKTPDAIIAATAKTKNITICTRNIQDFKNLDLMVVNPYDINE